MNAQEATLNAIATSLESLTQSLKAIASQQAPAPIPTLPADAEAAPSVVTHTPLTQNEIEAAVFEFNTLLQNGVSPDAIRQVIANNGLTQLADVGDNRVLFNKVLSEVRQLSGAAA